VQQSTQVACRGPLIKNQWQARLAPVENPTEQREVLASVSAHGAKPPLHIEPGDRAQRCQFVVRSCMGGRIA